MISGNGLKKKSYLYSTKGNIIPKSYITFSKQLNEVIEKVKVIVLERILEDDSKLLKQRYTRYSLEGPVIEEDDFDISN